MEAYKSFQRKKAKSENVKVRRVKVAVIDNGFDMEVVGKHVPPGGGASFCYDYKDRECNWFLATDPHGTHMANFITQLDPFCELYVAKVGNSRTDITPDAVIQVCALSKSPYGTELVTNL